MKRMTDAADGCWRCAYAPKTTRLSPSEAQRQRDLVRWKFQRYAKNYLRCVKRRRRKRRPFMRSTSKTLGLEENTIVIYSSDQGFYIGDHGWYDKRWMYEESLKMPLIVKWPGVTKPGSKNTNLVQNLDYAETFLDIAGSPVPEDMQGRSSGAAVEGQITRRTGAPQSTTTTTSTPASTWCPGTTESGPSATS